MPPMDVTQAERQSMLNHMVAQLQAMNQPADKAGSTAVKVEEAAFRKANNREAYMQYLRTSMQKAKMALQRQAATAQQQHAAHMTQQAHHHHPAAIAQQAQQQQQHSAAVAQQQQQQFGAQQQYMQQQAPQQQYMQQQAPQQQYMQQAAMQQPVQQQYMQQGAQQQFARPQMPVQAGQPQYMQQQHQQQHQHQAHYMQPQAAQPMQQQYMQQPGVQAQYVQQPAAQQQYVQQPAQQAQQAAYMQQQPVMAGQQQYVQVQLPPQQQAPQAQAQPYMQAPGGSGYPVQQYAPAAAAVPAPLPPQQQQVQQAGIQPRQLAPAEINRLPSFNDPEFGNFAAEFFPESVKPPVAVKQQQISQQQVPPPGATAAAQQQQQQQRFLQQQQLQQQQAALQPVVAESLGPAAAAGSGQACDGTDAAQARRPLQHDPDSLKEFLRLHKAFNNPEYREVTLKDSERMLQFYRDTANAKKQPEGDRLATRANRYTMILRLLTANEPHQRISINDRVTTLTKNFLRELSQFKEMMKKTNQTLAGAGSGGASAATAGSAASPGGFLALMESGDADAVKLTVPSLGTTGAAGTASTAAVKQSPSAAAAAPAAAAAQGAAASAAAEAARQQALARQRQLAEANAEAQRRRDAAAAAAAALPAAGPARLLAVVQQAREPQDGAAVQAGFRRLQAVLMAAEQRQLAPSLPQGVSTPPLPDEVKRLVAREREALERQAEAASAAPGGGQGGATAVLTLPVAEGRIAGPGGDGDADALPAAKRQCSASPELAAGGGAAAAAEGQGRHKSELELRLAAECEEVAATLGGALLLHVAPDSTADPRDAVVACLPKAAQAQQAAGPTNAGASGGAAAVSQQWQRLVLRVPQGYPAEAPTAVFHRTGLGSSASEAQAATLVRHQQLLDACRERFGQALEAGPSPPRLQQIAQAWLAATQKVAALVAGDGSDGAGAGQ